MVEEGSTRVFNVMKEKRIGLNLRKCRAEGQFRVQSFRWLLRHEVDVAGKALVDLGAGPCNFARIAHEFGARVTAVDGRDDRVPDDIRRHVRQKGGSCTPWRLGRSGSKSGSAGSHGAEHGFIRFVQEDVRKVNLEDFDIVLIFGLLYHFEIEDQIELLRRCRDRIVLVDTMVCLPELITRYPRKDWECVLETCSGYEGWIYPEKDNAMASIGNRRSFWHTERSYARLFGDCGFMDVTAYRPLYLAENGMRSFYRLMPG